MALQKRLFLSSFLVLILLVSFSLAFGGGGGSSTTTNPTPQKSVAYFSQGSNVEIQWNAPQSYVSQDNKYTSLQPEFISISIYVADPYGTNVASWTRNENSGTLSWNIPSNTPIGSYTITTFAEYDEPVPQGVAQAYEKTTTNTVFMVQSQPRTYKRGEIVPLAWYASASNPNAGAYNIVIKVAGPPNGLQPYSCEAGGFSGTDSAGSCDYTIPGDAVAGTFEVVPYSCDGCSSFQGLDANTARSSFIVAENTIPPGNNPGSPCGTGNTCNNGLQCSGGVCINNNVNVGGVCNSYNLCGSGLTCSNGVCVNPNTPQPPADQQAIGVTDGVGADKYVRGWARDPDWQGAGQYINVQFYIDGTYAGTTTANNPSEPAVGGNGNHRFAWMIPQQYWNGQTHEVWAYGIGRLSSGSLSGSNPVLGSPSYQSRSFNFQPPTVTCTSFTYSSWSTCSNGQQTRTVASSSPSGCTGGNPVLSQSCTAGNGGVCSSNNHCNSGLTCSNNVCTDPTPQYHNECVNQQCVQVSGAGSNSCSINANCLNPVGGVCNASYGCQSGLQCNSGICQTIPNQEISSASWAKMDGSSISSADREDTLLMTAQGSNLHLEAGQVTFKVYKKQALLDSKVDEKTVNVAFGTTKVNSTYKATEEGTFYFKVSAGNSERTSSNVVVGSTISNSPPVPSISSPQSGGIYFTGSTIRFAHSSYDVDDSISSVKWNFGDGSTDNSNSPTHTYSSTGQKKIVLEVTDSRGLKASQTIDINIANQNGYTLFAFIESPKNGAAIVSSNLVADYSGKQSYVISTTVTGTNGCTVTVQCIQGQCPATTSASPSCATNPNAQILINGGQQPHTQLYFNWTFRDGNAYLSPEMGMGKTSGTKGFSDYGIKNISLQVKYNANGQNLQATYNRGFILFNQRQCSVDGATWNKVENGVVSETRDTLSTAACAGLDLQAGTGDDCCPNGFVCSTTGTVGCKLDSSANQTLGCSSYTGQSACNSDANNRARNELLWDYYNCGESINGQNVLCSCLWNSQTSKCEMQRSNRADGNPLFGTLSQCSYTTQTSQCVDGYQNVQIDASVIGGGSSPECTDSTQVLPCGKPVVALPFFGTVQLIIATIAVIIMYLILKNLGKNKRKSKR